MTHFLFLFSLCASSSCLVPGLCLGLILKSTISLTSMQNQQHNMHVLKKKNCTTTYFFPLNASIMVGSLFEKFCANIFLKKKKINLWLLVYTTAKNLPLPMSCSLMVLKTIKFIFEKTPTFSAYVSPLCFQIVHFLWYFWNSTAGRQLCLRMPVKQGEKVTKKKTRVTNKNNVKCRSYSHCS